MVATPKRSVFTCHNCLAKLGVRKGMEKKQVECPRCSEFVPVSRLLELDSSVGSPPTRQLRRSTPSKNLSESTEWSWWGFAGGVAAAGMWAALLFAHGPFAQRCVSVIAGATLATIALVLVIGTLWQIGEPILALIGDVSEGSDEVDFRVADCAPTVDLDTLGYWLGGFVALVGGIFGWVLNPGTEQFPLVVLLLATVGVVALGWWVCVAIVRFIRR